MNYRVGHTCDKCKDTITEKCKLCGGTEMVINALCRTCKLGDDMNDDLQELINRKNIVKEGDCCSCKNDARQIRNTVRNSKGNVRND